MWYKERMEVQKTEKKIKLFLNIFAIIVVILVLLWTYYFFKKELPFGLLSQNKTNVEVQTKETKEVKDNTEGTVEVPSDFEYKKIDLSDLNSDIKFDYYSSDNWWNNSWLAFIGFKYKPWSVVWIRTIYYKGTWNFEEEDKIWEDYKKITTNIEGIYEEHISMSTSDNVKIQIIDVNSEKPFLLKEMNFNVVDSIKERLMKEEEENQKLSEQIIETSSGTIMVRTNEV